MHPHVLLGQSNRVVRHRVLRGTEEGLPGDIPAPISPLCDDDRYLGLPQVRTFRQRRLHRVHELSGARVHVLLLRTVSIRT